MWTGTRSVDLRLEITEARSFAIDYSLVSLILCVLWVMSLRLYETRDHKIIGVGVTEYKRVADATIRIFGLVAITMYLFRTELGRGFFLTALPLGFLLILIGRWSWRQWLVRRRRQGAYLYRTLLVGQHSKNVHVAREIISNRSAGFLAIGAMTKAGKEDRDVAPGVPVLGSFSEILEIVSQHNVDTVVLTGADDISPKEMRELGWSLDEVRVNLVVAPSLTDVAGPRIHSRQVAGLSLIHVAYPRFEGARQAAKRVFDIVASTLGLLILSPLFLWIAIAVRHDSPGPAFFRQVRVGHNGKTFGMLKFRSMGADAEDRLPGLLDSSGGNGVMFKIRRDPRVTKVGKILRRYSLDEVPQLINVLQGTMSLVGPRPPLAREVEQYDRWTHRKFLVKPGITGLWQVSGRSNLSWDDSVRLDLYYVENWSLTGDIVILYRTVRTVLRPDGAY